MGESFEKLDLQIIKDPDKEGFSPSLWILYKKVKSLESKALSLVRPKEKLKSYQVLTLIPKDSAFLKYDVKVF